MADRMHHRPLSRSPPSPGTGAATHDPPATAPPDRVPSTWRRRSSPSLLGMVLVLVVAQAGAALGGSSLAAPERRPAVLARTSSRPGDSLWSSPSGSHPATTRARSSTRSSRPATASRSCRASARVGGPRSSTLIAHGGPALRVGPPWLRRRCEGADVARHGRRRAVYRCRMRCPYCEADDDKVVDSRPADEGAAVRRRRECLACGRRYTTYERLDELPLLVVKRSGARDPFDARRSGPGSSARWPAARSRPAVDALAVDVEEAARARGPRSRASGSACAVLERLRPARSGRRTCGSPRSTRASTTSPTSSARSSSSRRPPPRRSAALERPRSARVVRRSSGERNRLQSHGVILVMYFAPHLAAAGAQPQI